MPDGPGGQIASNLALLDQAEAAIERLADGLAAPSAIGRATAGAHFRHVFDHYRCLLVGLASGRVDYHERQRDQGVESDPERALEACRACREALLRDAPSRLDDAIRVRTGADPARKDWATTSVRRELAFCASHTLHHLAIVTMIARERGVDLDETLGVAPSTAAHRNARPVAAATDR